MSDEELDQALAALRQLLADREAAAQGQLIDAEPVEPALIGPPLDTEGTAEPATIPAPALADEQIDATLDALREITRGVRRRGGGNVIKGTAEPVAPEAQSPRGYARAHAKTQVEPPDEGGRHGGRPAGAQAEQAMKRGRGRGFAFALVKMR
jgi:hypothetical protein